MKRLLVVLLVLLMLAAGCSSSPFSGGVPSTSGVSVPTKTSDNTSPVEERPIKMLDNPPPETETWISPGKVNIGNFYPGARAEYPLTIHNGEDVATKFLVKYRYPDHVAEGYEKPIAEVQDWVIIADTTPILLPKETKDILIALEMPKDANVFAKKWEFWVSVSKYQPGAQIVTEMATRWLVNMRD